VENLEARTEINNAWANVALADNCVKHGEYIAASDALADAEVHYKKAQSVITIEKSGPVRDNLDNLRVRLDQLRSAIARARGTVPFGAS